jgi:hypothetical protein
MSEIMTEKGLSLGVVVNQIATILIGTFTLDIIDALGEVKGLPPGENKIGGGRLFVICGAITVAAAFFILFFVKETKGLTDKQVANLYSRKVETEAPEYNAVHSSPLVQYDEN